jgi:pimeloyl-ACP methyl ester carboxylesterase
MNIKSVRLVGFSFGGRIAIALAAHKPHLVKQLSLTCVPLHRPGLGTAILRSWEESLERGNLREAAWSFVLNGYSENFLERFSQRLSTFVDIIVTSNDANKLRDLMKYSHVSDPSDPMSPSFCIKLLKCPIQIIAATKDRIAGFSNVEDLYSVAKESNSDVSYHVIDTGHVAPFEDPVGWRTVVANFLFKPSTRSQ